MTRLLEEAFSKASQLPDEQQEALAAWILEELSSEARWDKDFATSSDALASLANEALAEHHAGRTKAF